MQALGMIETRGTLAAIEAVDVMLKAADVTLVEKTKIAGVLGGGIHGGAAGSQVMWQP